MQICLVFYGCPQVSHIGDHAVANSVIPNAYQIPEAPKIRLKINAVGIMMIVYLHSEMIRDGVPFPSPSSAPELVMDTEETKNPRLIIRSAIPPA